MSDSKITLKYEDETQIITHEIKQGDGKWETHLQSMINFLRGVGYYIPEDEDKV